MGLFDDILEEQNIKNTKKEKIDFFNIDNIKIPKNITIMLYGDGGLGKSWFLGNICGEIANQENVCILYHNIDSNCSPSFMKAFELKSKSEKILELNTNFEIDDKKSKKIVSLITAMSNKAQTKQIIYIIDTLDSAKNIYAKNINFDNSDTSNDAVLIEKFYSDLNDLRNELKKNKISISIILVHHSNKSNEAAGSFKIQTGLPLIYKIAKDEKKDDVRIIELVKNNGIIDEKINFSFKLNKNNEVTNIVLKNTLEKKDFSRFDKVIENDQYKINLPDELSLKQKNTVLIDRSPVFNNLNLKIECFDDIPKFYINDNMYAVLIPNDFGEIFKFNDDKKNNLIKGEVLNGINGEKYIYNQKLEKYKTLNITHKKILLAVFNDLIVSKKDFHYCTNINYTSISKYLNINAKRITGREYKSIPQYLSELANSFYSLVILNNNKQVIKFHTGFNFFNVSESSSKQKSTMITFNSIFIDLFLRDIIIDVNKYGRLLSNLFNDNLIFSIITYLLTEEELRIEFSDLVEKLGHSRSNKNILKTKQKLKNEILNNINNQSSFLQSNIITEDKNDEENLFADLSCQICYEPTKIADIENKEVKQIVSNLKNSSLLEKLKIFGIELEYKEINKRMYSIYINYKRPKDIKYYDYKKNLLCRFNNSGSIIEKTKK